MPLPPSRAGRRWALALALVASTLAAAGGGGWWWRERQEAVHRAVQLTSGDPTRGQGLIRNYGCAGCHTVPGVPGATGRAAPSLQGVAGRVWLAGVVENTPANMIRWIEDPRAIDARTAMPPTGAGSRDARDIAAYF
jgi:cytochrome c